MSNLYPNVSGSNMSIRKQMGTFNQQYTKVQGVDDLQSSWMEYPLWLPMGGRIRIAGTMFSLSACICFKAWEPHA